jgi:hypothetical protein
MGRVDLTPAMLVPLAERIDVLADMALAELDAFVTGLGTPAGPR